MSFATSGSARQHPSREYADILSGPSLSSARLGFVPIPIALLLLALLLPAELDFEVGGLRLNCQRLLLIVFLPIAFARLFAGRGPQLRSFDILLVGAFAYCVFAVFLKEPFNKALQSGGVIFVESVGGYVLARAYIRSIQQFLATVKLLFVLALIAGALAIPESFLHSHIARNAAAAIHGLPGVTWEETRLGLLRAMSVFDHPIHYGAFCASVFGLVWFTEEHPLKRLFRACLIGGAAFFSLSAGPLQGLGLILVGAIWEPITRPVPNRVWLTIVALALVYLLVSLVANRPPLQILVTSFVLDSGSYWYRTLIWDYGVDNVLAHPWIGVPLGSWERPDWMQSPSVDNHWLTMALWGGLPFVGLFILSALTLFRAVHGRAAVGQPPEFRRCRYGWMSTVLALYAVAATVAYWSTLGVLFAFYLGLGAWLTETHQGSRAPRARLVRRLQASPAPSRRRAT